MGRDDGYPLVKLGSPLMARNYNDHPMVFTQAGSAAGNLATAHSPERACGAGEAARGSSPVPVKTALGRSVQHGGEAEAA